jgi:hypothetical protein
MMLLAGDPFMILAGFLGGAFLFVGPRPPSPGWKPLFVGLALGVLLAAPSLLALRQYFPATVRAGGLPAVERPSMSLHPLEAIGFFVPNAFGSRVIGGPNGFLYPGQGTYRFDASGGDVHIIEDAGSRVVLRTSGGGGFLVLTDCFAPGWRARIDGRLVTIFPADIAFRMIVVPTGTHDVVFDYNPWRT